MTARSVDTPPDEVDQAIGRSSHAGGDEVADSGSAGDSPATGGPDSRSAAGDRPVSERAAGDEAAGDEAAVDEAAVDESATEEELFQQSEIAADYLEGLLDVLDMDGDIDELVANGRPIVEVVGGRLQSLVGQRGATLEALQDLARLAVFRRTGEPSRLLLDIGGYRANRRNELAAVARNAIERVREHGEPVRLEPMSAFERKCVHDVVNATDGVASESQGEEPNRRIVVRSE
jgi:spoIIIJ-associated protein